MQPVPINFRLTAAAANEIASLTDEASAGEQEPLVPVIGWHEEYEEVDRRLVEYGISLGWFKSSQIAGKHIQTVDGVRLIFNVQPKQAYKFNNRVIDFSNGRFVFL